MIVGYGESCTGWRVRRFPAGSKIFFSCFQTPKPSLGYNQLPIKWDYGGSLLGIKSDDDKKLIAHVHLLS